MESSSTANTSSTFAAGSALSPVTEAPPPFSLETVEITKREYIELKRQAHHAQSLHQRAKLKIEELEKEKQSLQGKINDLNKRLFGKTSEKGGSSKSEQGGNSSGGKTSSRKKGQQKGSKGHGRTDHSALPVHEEEVDLDESDKCCPQCGLSHHPNSALDEVNEIREIEISAHTRRITRKGYTRHPQCSCETTPAVITPPPVPQLFPGGSYGVSIWSEVILQKFLYAQPINRLLQDLADQNLTISPGTISGGLKKMEALFQPIMEAIYCKQMSDPLFHNDETRWEVFEKIEGKAGHRWYLWVTRSQSAIYYTIDPSRAAGVPGAHFAGIQNDQVIIICDRYSAYKKLSRLSAGTILLAYCWAHVRRDFINAATAHKELETWALQWKERIATLYHHNRQRLEEWDREQPIDLQSPAFKEQHRVIQETLEQMRADARQFVADTEQEKKRLPAIKARQRKVLNSLLTHWEGLNRFVEQPQIPMDNNIAENSIRGPVNGRKNYYGSGSIWSAELAATLFSILQTLKLWGVNPRNWLYGFLNSCAMNGGTPAEDIRKWLPWEMDESHRQQLSQPCRYQPPHPIPPYDSS